MVMVIKMLKLQSSSTPLKESGRFKSAGQMKKERFEGRLHMKYCEILPVEMFYC